MTALNAFDVATRSSRMEKKKKNWIKSAIPKSHEGKFSAKAERAGESTQEFAKKHEDAPGKLGKEARLAETLMKMGHKKRRMAILSHPSSR